MISSNDDSYSSIVISNQSIRTRISRSVGTIEFLMMRTYQTVTFFLYFVSQFCFSNGFNIGSGINHHDNLLQRQSFSSRRELPFTFTSTQRGSSALRMLIAEESAANMQGLLQNSDVWVFLIGAFPFAWASVEFWRRIAFGEPFGTGSDSVIIGTDDAPMDSRGTRVLGKGALAIAYFLFAASFATIALVLYAFISSSPPPEILPSQQMAEESINAMLQN
jgi:hypothetical protein